MCLCSRAPEVQCPDARPTDNLSSGVGPLLVSWRWATEREIDQGSTHAAPTNVTGMWFEMVRTKHAAVSVR
jgi:hypothetical protein